MFKPYQKLMILSKEAIRTRIYVSLLERKKKV